MTTKLSSHRFLNRILRRIIDRRLGLHWIHYIFQSLCAVVCVFVVLVSLRGQNLLVAASLAATAFTIFVMPRSVTASARNVIGGHSIGILSGLLFAMLTPENVFLQDFLYAMLVGCVLFIMSATNTEHPPAAGSALGIAMTPPEGMRMGLGIIMGVLLLALMHQLLRPLMRDLIARSERSQ
jgi:CBS-domain-containing membrane protein